MAGDSANPIFIHVGFCNTGTTSLQLSFFAKRNDVFFVGEPYGDRGGIFTRIRSVEDFKLDRKGTLALCERQIFQPSGTRPIVISDEALCDTPQIYFAPFTLPRDCIAQRLSEFFPNAKIIFTIREQTRYIASMYLRLKHNAAFMDRCAIPTFGRWFAGMLSQVRCHYLQNINFMECIELYHGIFGRENICVLPLEVLVADGAREFLGRLCDFMQLELRDEHIANFMEPLNTRMSQRKELVSELIVDDRFYSVLRDASETFGARNFAAFMDGGPKASLSLDTAQVQEVRLRVAAGNSALAREYGLDLGRYGYLLADDGPSRQVMSQATAVMSSDS